MKKVFEVMLLVIVAAAVAAPQEAPPAPGVEVISNSWRREVRNPALLDDPQVFNQNRNPDRAQREVDQENNSRLKANRILLPETPTKKTQRSLEDPSVAYVYEVKILNTGGQTITRIDWQFDLLEANTKREVGHHTFTSRTNIQSGKAKKLVARSRSHPASLVDVANAGEKSPNQYAVRVIINRIEYDGGPAWVRTSN